MLEAKRLLLSTSLSVADIACRVGYPGIGTFTTRFTRMVGVSPGRYRLLPRDRMLCLTQETHKCIAQNGISEMSDMRRFVRIDAGVLD